MDSVTVVRFHTKNTSNIKKTHLGFGVDLVSVGVFFRLSEVHLRWSFSVFFRPPFFFFVPGRYLGGRRARKGAKSEPKVMTKEVRAHFLEHAKTMAGVVPEAYGEFSGRVRATLF